MKTVNTFHLTVGSSPGDVACRRLAGPERPMTRTSPPARHEMLADSSRRGPTVEVAGGVAALQPLRRAIGRSKRFLVRNDQVDRRLATAAVDAAVDPYRFPSFGAGGIHSRSRYSSMILFSQSFGDHGAQAHK